HGLLRSGEREQVERDFVAATGAKLHTVDARDRFLDALAGFSDPEEKRKIIGREFIRVFEAATAEVAESEHVGFLVQGTLDRDIWQCPVVLLADVRSVGVQGDGRTYGHPVVLRPVSSEDAMTADWTRLPYDLLERISTRITNEVAEVNRVVLDVTSKPPGTIEWE